jgi:putative transcriptional regulator
MSAFKSIRERLGMTQQAIADEIGCTQGNVHFYEKGQTVPPKVAAKLIEAAAARGLALTYDHVYGAAQLPEVVPGEPAAQA